MYIKSESLKKIYDSSCPYFNFFSLIILSNMLGTIFLNIMVNVSIQTGRVPIDGDWSKSGLQEQGRKKKEGQRKGKGFDNRGCGFNLGGYLRGCEISKVPPLPSLISLISEKVKGQIKRRGKYILITLKLLILF